MTGQGEYEPGFEPPRFVDPDYVMQQLSGGLMGWDRATGRWIVREEFARGDLTDITISTRLPGKWRFVDTETREVWRWDGRYVRADEPFPDGWITEPDETEFQIEYGTRVDPGVVAATNYVPVGPEVRAASEGDDFDALIVPVRIRSLSESMDWVTARMEQDPDAYTAVQLALLLGMFADRARAMERTMTDD